MSEVVSSTYVPYGAYELKASYQRNLIQATLLVAGFVLTVVAVAILLSPTATQPVRVIDIDSDVGRLRPIRPPTIILQRRAINVSQPPAITGEIGIPIPIPDSEFFDDDVDGRLVDDAFAVRKLCVPGVPGDRGLALGLVCGRGDCGFFAGSGG